MGRFQGEGGPILPGGASMPRKPARRFGDSREKGRRTASRSPGRQAAGGWHPHRPERRCHLWDTVSGRVLGSMADSLLGTMAVAFSPDGKVLTS